MNVRWVSKFGAVIAALAVVLTTLTIATPPAQAQQDQQDVFETCAFYGLIAGTGGQGAADAAAGLQALGAPNPFGIDVALETIINFEADIPPIGSRPADEAVLTAQATLADYFGGICADLDICPLVRQAIATNDGSSAEAARLVRGITAPGPPGISVALAVISGEIAESPDFPTVVEAQEQIGSYFPCDLSPTPGPIGGLPADVAATCGDLAVLSVPEGPFAIEAAESLRARGAPNPPAIEAALDLIVLAANFASEPPPLAEIDAAVASLQGYFGGACDNLDRCPFVAQIGGSDPTASAEAARLLRRIETPQPPGIDAALALIAGDVNESPFHDSVAQALAQVLDYYPCNEAGGGDATEPPLAFTGATTAPLALLGAALVVSGAGVLRMRRSLLDT